MKKVKNMTLDTRIARMRRVKKRLGYPNGPLGEWDACDDEIMRLLIAWGGESLISPWAWRVYKKRVHVEHDDAADEKKSKGRRKRRR